MKRRDVQTRDRRYLQVFQQVTKMISQVLDHRQVMENIVRSLPELLEIDACTIRLLDQATGAFVLGAAAGLSPEYLSRPDVDSEETMEMVSSGHPVARVDVSNSPHQTFREAAMREGIQSVLSLPIFFQGEIIGIMRLLTRSGRLFTVEEISFAMALAEQVGIAISNGRMFTQLEHQERFLADILDCIRQQLLVVDRHRRVVMANRAFLEINGRKESNVLGMDYGRICRMEQEGQFCPVDQVLLTGQMATIVQQVDEGDGPHWYERMATPMTNDAGELEFVIEIIRDLTIQRRLEAEQAERSKLEGVIEMAGTVAHEINSPLFAALGTAQLLETDPADDAQKEDFRTIVRNLQIISELTAKMTAMTGYRNRDYVGETRIIAL
jgi:two-component system, NtrC family, sensor kinase